MQTESRVSGKCYSLSEIVEHDCYAVGPLHFNWKGYLLKQLCGCKWGQKEAAYERL